MKTIPLTQGQVAMVDDEDYPELCQFRWYAAWDVRTRTYRAGRYERLPDGTYKNTSMHRQVMKALPDQQVDHINHDTLDNRRANLRFCTQGQNQANRRKDVDSTSPYKGVSWHRRNRKWIASIKGPGGRIHLGYHKSAIDAARAYDKAAVELWGEFAHTNGIEPGRGAG